MDHGAGSDRHPWYYAVDIEERVDSFHDLCHGEKRVEYAPKPGTLFKPEYLCHRRHGTPFNVANGLQTR